MGAIIVGWANKCLFRLDAEGWLEIYDGHDTVGLPPEEAEALRVFLSPRTSAARPGDRREPEQSHPENPGVGGQETEP